MFKIDKKSSSKINFVNQRFQKSSANKQEDKLLQFETKLIYFSVTELPTDHVDDSDEFWGARAVTSASGQGAIVQYYEYFYELKCEINGCSWSILPNQLNQGVRQAVMMTVPEDYYKC